MLFADAPRWSARGMGSMVASGVFRWGMTLRVVEIGGVAAGYCGRLFAHGGATVLRLDAEPMDDSSRSQALDAYLHTGKQRVRVNALDVAARLREIVQGADIVIADVSATELDRWAWQSWPAAVRVAITPFGLTGPYRDWQATGSVLLALGGYTALIGDPERAPLSMPGHYAEYQSGQFAYIAALSTRDAVSAGTLRAGREIDVSMLETVLSLSQITTVMWTFMGQVRSRHGNYWQNLYPLSLYRCRDGWFSVNIVPTFWQAFTNMLGMPELFTDPRFATNDGRMANKSELAAIIEAKFAACTMAELLELGQRVSRVPTGIALSIGEVLDDPHLAARDFWRRLTTADGREVRAPRVPFQYAQVRSNAALPPRHKPAAVTVLGPLNGVRIADFTHVWAGPLGTRVLADLGAEVVKIEAPFARGPAHMTPTVAGIYPGAVLGDEHWNRQGITNKLNRNKKGLAIDLKHPRGYQLVAELISQCDVVVDNFSARAMTAMGFGFAKLLELNPAIIHVAMPGYGLSGPYQDFVAFGPSVEPMSGLTSLMGYSDDEPRTTALALPDAIAGVTAAAAVVAALHRRRALSETGLIELSLHEGAIALFGEYFLERQLTGLQPSRQANRHPVFAPHGVYRCAGDDDWIALACETDDNWRDLVKVLGMSTMPHWGTYAGRRSAEDAIDGVIADATRKRERRTLMNELQSIGVAAGAVTKAPDLFADAHIQARNFFVPLGAPHIRTMLYPSLPLCIDGARTSGWFAAPRLGEHNAEVVCGMLGHSADELAQWQEEKVLWARPSI